jgi:hypothetical protein
MVHEKYPHILGKGRLTPGKGIKAGADDNILPHAAGRGLGQTFLGKSAPVHERRAQQNIHLTTVIIDIVADRLFRSLWNEADDNRVFEDAGPVENLVSGSPRRRANHRITGLSGEHERLLNAWA